MFSKFIGAVLILLSSIFISKNITARLKKRAESLKSFERFLVLLEGEITYRNNPLDTAFSNISSAVNLGEFLPFVISSIKIDGVRKSWQVGIKTFKSELALTDRDTKILLSFSHQLGATDRDNQIKNIQYIHKLLEDSINDAETSYQTLSRLYRNISLSAGIGAIILLI